MERLIEKVVIEGAEFEIIQKPETLYAGYKAEADNGGEESKHRYRRTFSGWL